MPARSAPSARKAGSLPRQPRPRPAGPLYHPGPPINGEAALDRAVAQLLAADPDTIGHLVAIGGSPPLRWRDPGFAGLAAIVTGQQLSTASAAAIFRRLEEQIVPLTPERLLEVPAETLRALGMSAAKITTLRAIATAMTEGRLALAGLADVAAEEAHAALVAIRGIGPWTADAFLLFCLGHPDAFPAGDLALQEAARVALKLDARPDAAALHAIGERWRPLRGVAARLLWAYYRAIKQGRAGMVLASP